ncbi:ShlB/FhaC/HecB family hemolysin secretion/activation protein [bacterium]|nr:ShlB/FhaC/HecB family hemolysin secretion/activation protein [bacterium]
MLRKFLGVGVCSLILLTRVGWAQPAPGASEEAPSTQGPSAASVKVTDFLVDGNTLLSNEELQAVLAPYKGQDLTFQGLRDLADKLTEAYNKKGYFTVRAFLPEQTVRGGQVKFLVTEAKKGTVTYQGNENYSREYIQWMMEPALQEDYLNKDDVERQILLLNESMGLKASTILEAGEKPGTVDLTVNSEEKKLQRFTLDYNNYGSRFTGYDRPGALIELGNLTGNGDKLSLRAMRSVTSQGVTLLNANYSIPVSNEGTRLSFLYSNSAFAVGRELQVLDLRGDAQVYGGFVSHPFVRSAKANVDFNGGILFQDINNSVLGTPIGRDRLRELILGVSGDWSEDDARNFFNFRLTQDTGRLLGGLSPNDAFSTRQAGGGFSKVNMDLGRIQKVSEQSFFILRGSHQFALAPLPTAEQFSLGGPDSVRGYRQASYLGDGGYNLSAEFRYSPIQDHLDLFQVAAFLDHGGAYLKRPQPGEIPNVSATGAGVGVRFKPTDNMVIRADLGYPIGDNAITRLQGKHLVPYIFFSNTF